MNNLTNIGLLVLRVSVSAIMIVAHGLGKLSNPAPFIENLAKNEFPMPSVLGYMTISAETLFPLLIILGLFTRISALIAAINMFVAAFIFHAMINGDPFGVWEKPVLYFLIFISIAIAGAGDWTVKRLFGGGS